LRTPLSTSPGGRAGPDDHVVADQSAVFACLADPATHGLPAGETVRRIDTHGAAVFLAGDRAYKVKRAVAFPFMDFSTVEKRRAACLAECAISGANAPGLYLGVRAITRGPAGLRLGGDGEAVDYAVEMRRFDPAETFDQLAQRGGLDADLLSALAASVARAHAAAPVVRGRDVVASLGSYLADNRRVFAATPDLFSADAAALLAATAEAALERLAPVMRARAAAGFVRRCHGDLHLANIVRLDGAPVLFDAIEFNDDIATCDVLYDLAFLLMDLWQRGLKGAANGVFNRYLWLQADDDALDGLAALPFFLSLRAAIRAKVEAAGLGHLPAAAQPAARTRIRHLFACACAFLGLESEGPGGAGSLPEALRAPGPLLCAIGGLSGSGKTTRALEWAPAVGCAPGAVVLRSDVERKRLFGVAQTAPLPPEAYAPEVTPKVYARLRALAARVLATGQSVIVDAVHAQPDERAAIEAVAATAGVPFQGIWLEVPLALRVERVEHRRAHQRDASDADAQVARSQEGYALGDMRWLRLANS